MSQQQFAQKATTEVLEIAIPSRMTSSSSMEPSPTSSTVSISAGAISPSNTSIEPPVSKDEDAAIAKTPIFVYICAILACISSLNYGYGVGIIATAIIYIEEDLGINDTQIELMVAAANFFAIIGSIIGGQFAHKFGRKKIIIASAVISCIAVVLMAVTSNFVVILVSRSLNGISGGMSLLVIPLYTAELAPAHIRGKLVSSNELFINIGIVVGYTIALLFFYVDIGVDITWRIMVASGSIISGILYLSMLFMPESPRWLNQHGHTTEAVNVLNKITNSKEEVDQIIAEMDETNKELEQNKIGWKEIILPFIFKPDKALQRALIIGVPLCIFHQASGVQIFVYYIPKILKENGLNDEFVFLGTIFIGMAKLLFVLVSQALTDKLGRRKLLLIGSLSMTMSVGILGIILQFQSELEYGSFFMIGMLVLVVATFSIGYGPNVWLVNSEIFAVNVRSKAMAYCTVWNRLAASAVSLTFFTLQSALTPYGAFYFYFGINVLCFIFIWFKVPETKSKTLEEITKMLMR